MQSFGFVSDTFLNEDVNGVVEVGPSTLPNTGVDSSGVWYSPLICEDVPTDPTSSVAWWDLNDVGVSWCEWGWAELLFTLLLLFLDLTLLPLRPSNRDAVDDVPSSHSGSRRAISGGMHASRENPSLKSLADKT